MHRTTRRWVTGGAALGAAALLAVPAVVFAQSGGTDPTTSTTVPATAAPTTTEAPSGSGAPSTTAPSSTSKAKSPESWIKGVLDGLVKDGTITQAQEDSIIKALQDAKPALGDRPFGHGGPLGRGALGLGLDAVAKALGITVDELRTELQTKTIAEIAKDHGIDVQKVIGDVTATAKTMLDDAVKAGRISQAEADARLTALTDKMTQLVNQKLPFPDKAERHRDNGHESNESDEGGATTSSAPTTTTG
jgi:hypothetical protein